MARRRKRASREIKIRYPLPNKTEKTIKTGKDKAEEKEKRKTGKQRIKEYYMDKDGED